MTKHENEILFNHVGKFDAFLDDFKEYKKEVKESLKDNTEAINSLSSKVVEEQKEDAKKITNLDKRILDIEKTKRNINIGIKFLLSAGTIGVISALIKYIFQL